MSEHTAERAESGTECPMTEDELREAFSMQYDAEHKFPFTEDENCNITGYGHQDPVEFAAAINRYDEVCNGEPFPEDEQWDEGYVGHYWVTIAEDGEHLLRCTPDEAGAIPVTGLWGQR